MKMDSGRIDRTPGHHISLSLGGGVTNGSQVTPGVLVKDARKAYGNRPPILSGFSMNVPQGSIYGLLGSSGCGKTTILSCIVGLRKIDGGEISVFGAKPGTIASGVPGPLVGYMPQEIALYENMSIKEILQYYGRIYGMTKDDIEKRMGYLMGLLDLPESHRIIGTLSGGQQRRTSLAVALVHQARLLILDEPTVGVDPLVRQKIWDHLVNLVKTKKTTVIVTTHYIEECRTANVVGLMRNGRLLTEKAPNSLLLEHNAELLEDIVLKLCKKDNLDLISDNPSNEVSQALQEISFYTGNKNLTSGGRGQGPVTGGDKSPIVGIKFKRRFTEENMMAKRSLSRQQSVAEIVQDVAEEFFYSRGDRIMALILRNYITFFRNILFVLCVLLIPAVQLIIIRFVIGYEPKNMDFGMVNYEVPFGNDTTICPFEDGCLSDGMSCKYVSSLPKDNIIMHRMESEEEALQAVTEGRIWGYMSIPLNFTEHMKDRALSKNFATNETLEGTSISFKMDMSLYLAAQLLTKLFYENYQKFIQQLASDCDQSSAAADLPVHYRKPVYGNLETGYQEFISPAALLIMLFFVPLASGGIAYIKDKKQGTLDRSMVAGVTTFDVVTSFMVTEGSLIVAQVLISFIILVFGFGFVIQGSIILFIVICLLCGLCGLSLGFFIAMICDEEMEAIISIFGLFTPVLLMSGIIWPLEGVHPVALFISYSLPCTFATEAIRSVAGRGWGLSHSHVYPGILMLLGWTVLCWLLTAIAYKIRHR